MKPLKCVLCHTAISHVNDSGEHIIPQAIGGLREVHGFLCQDCNKGRCHNWDTTLARQFDTVCLFLNIRRQRPLPSVTVDTADGKQLLLNPDGSTANRKTSLKPKITENTVELSHVPPHLLKGQIKGIKKKHKIERLHIEDGFEFQPHIYSLKWDVGGVDTCRSIMKTAMALAVDAGVDAGACNVAQRFLSDSAVPCNSCIGFFYSDDRDLIAERPVPVLHCVAINGNPQTKQLIGYVEYFSAFRMVVVVSDRYCGREFKKSYGIDPLSGTKLDIDADPNFTPLEVQHILNDEYYSETVRYNAVANLAAIATDRRLKKEDEFVARRIVRSAATSISIEDQDSLDRFTKEVTDKCKLFLRHNHARFSLRPDHYRLFRQHITFSAKRELRATARKQSCEKPTDAE